ncbi:hypothetical protein KAR91_78060 [Candidatus Pacearchaeota archaeon]|nr:hypothetical protein [Candidatus Pacearchaeota archaeon]
MARSKLFDNIMQNIKVRSPFASTAVVSTEIDLELPRGFVAKIHKVIIQVDDILETLVAGNTFRQEYALVLDPDDTVTTNTPPGNVEHDVICDGEISGSMETAAAMFVTETWRQYDFSHLEGMDILSARNMRFNSVGADDQGDGTAVECTIYYTLEKIEDAQIMELLDIL